MRTKTRTGTTVQKLLVLLTLSIAASIFGQQVPGRERGFKPGEAYQFGGFDSVNLFSGNLNLAVPLGQTYPVAEGVSYSFVLRYSGNIWHYSEWMKPEKPISSEPDHCYEAGGGLIICPATCTGAGGLNCPIMQHWMLYRDEEDPTRTFYFPMRDNAGMGWRLSFGELFPGATNATLPTLYSMWRYKSPDGGEHAFYDTLHEPRCQSPSDTDCDPFVAGVGYTRDGTYLRIKDGRAAGDRIVEFSDGHKQLFHCANPTSACQLRFIYGTSSLIAANGEPTTNYVKFEFDSENNWLITDSHQRAHKIYFQQPNPFHGMNRVIDKVDLAASGGARAVYDLTYDNFTFDDDAARTDGSISSIARPCGARDLSARTRFLTRIGLPDGGSFLMNYNHPAAADGCSDSSGTLTEVVTPARGKLTWSYQNYPVTAAYNSMGIRQRTAFDPFTNVREQSRYTADVGKTTVETLADDGTTVVTRTVNYFEPEYGESLGLPYTTTSTDGSGRNLSTETFDCPAGGTCTKVRATYLKYELDELASTCLIDFPCYRDRNPRVVTQRTSYADDGNRHADTDFSQFDGLGHYRQTNFTGNFTRGNDRETYTSFNLGVGSYELNSSHHRRSGFIMLAAGNEWILGTYGSTYSKEGDQYSRIEACFDTTTGFLKRTRSLGGENGVARSEHDLLSVFTRDDATGYVQREEFFGGDKQTVDKDPLTLLCDVALPDHDQYSFRIDHTYQRGVLATSQYKRADGSGIGFYSVNNSSIDASTGAVLQSKDPAGIATGYTYDTSGRLTDITPPAGLAPTSYVFEKAVADYGPACSTSACPQQAARITVKTGSNAETRLEQQFEYDGFGRLWREKRRMPDGTFSIRETLHDFAGRRKSVSEWETFTSGSPTKTTRFSDYDSLGRAGTVTAADGNATTFDYDGDRKTTRTYKVATPAGLATSVSVSEEADRFGRLISVTEDSANTAQKTDYYYRVGDQLSKVEMGSQPPRTFNYDGRGLLTWEVHPESGRTDYTYDARGHAVAKSGAVSHLSFGFDRAERLLEVTDTSHARTLKSFVYDTPSTLNAGRLVSQTRHNYLASGDHVVSDAFDYDGLGRVATKTTSVTEPGQAATTFVQAYAYTDLGLPDKAIYPTCSACTPAAGTTLPGRRDIAFSYRAGLLTNVSGVTDSIDDSQPGVGIAYSAAGQVQQVRHASVLDTITPDPSGLPRPKSITFALCNVINSQSSDKQISVGQTATFSIDVVPGATLAWYRGLPGDTSNPTGVTAATFTTPQLEETTTYWCLVRDSVCSRGSKPFTATICVPKIAAPALDYNGVATAIAEGTSSIIQIAVSGSGWTYKWEQAPVAVDANGVWSSTGARTVVGPADSLLTWTAPPYSASGSNFHGLFATVTGSCGTVTRLVKVFSVHAAVPCLKPDDRNFTFVPSGSKVILSVPDFDAADVAFNWYEGSDYDDLSRPAGSGSTIEVAPAVATNYWVLMTRTCSFGGVEVNRTPVKLVPASQEPTVQRISSYQKFHAIYAPGDAVQLWVDMDPAPSVPPSTDHVYHYEWYRDDPSGATKLPPDLSNPYVTTQSVNTFWVKVRGTHAGSSGEQITISPKMYVSVSGVCDLPPLYITQNRTTVPSDSIPDVTFIATCDWPNTSYQWFRGQSGDTRDPITSHAGPANQLTVGSFTIRPYWVRVTRDDCGAYTDSPTLSFQRDSCGPVLINQNVDSVDVAYDTTAFLTVEPPSFNATYTWRDESGSVVPGNGPTLVLPHVKESRRYLVHIADASCDRSEGIDSFLATVRVASSPSIAPPQWQTELWTDKNSSITLSAQAGGATGYQWYAGEVGDRHLPIGGATSATYTTPVLTAETKYWVRISGPNNELVDSPTITVKVCDPPHTAGASTTPRQDINAGQFITFSFPAAGTGLTYQWYEGHLGDTSLQRGRSIDHLQVHPTVTTSYWVRVTGHCGAGGTDARFIDSPEFIAAVCPVLEAPAVSQARVMPHARTTLSIAAQGANLTYQWYEGHTGDKSKPVANGNAASVQSPEIVQATTFWCEVIGVGGCARSSGEVSVQMCDVPGISWSGQIHTNAQPNEFQAISFITGDPGVPYSFTWYAGQPGNVANSQLLAVNNYTAFGVQPATTTTYWVRMTLNDSPCYSDSPGLTINVCIPRITVQPVAPSTTIAAGTPATLTVTTSVLAGQTYQWYAGASGVTSSPVAGATAATLTISPTATTTYWVRVTGTCTGLYADSAAATVNVCSPPQITSVSPTQFIASGTSTPISVWTNATSPSFKWYIGASGTKTNPVANSNSSSINVSPGATTSYWAEVTSAGVCVSNSPAIVVNVCTPPSFSLQPQSQAIFSGTAATLTAAASSPTGTVTYQWYTGATGDTSAPINGAVSATLTVTPATETSYWVRATTSVCTADSNTAVVSICLYPQVVDGNPAEKLIGYGASTTIALPAMSPVADKYVTWYRGVSGDHTTILGGALNLSSYTTPALTATTQYWAEFTNGGCTSRTSTYTVRVCIPAITTQPSGTTIPSGSSATLTAVTTNISGQTFQWYVGTPGTMTSPVPGATSSSLTISPASTTTYWLRVTGTCGISVNSAAATVTVCSPPVITATSPTRYIEAGTPASVSVTATGSNLTYQWYIGNSGVTTSPISGAVGLSCTVSPSTTTTYWCRVTSAGLCTINGPTLTVDVCNKPSITTQPASSRIFPSKPTTLTVAATSPRPLSYQWYTGVSGDVTSPIGGATSTSVTVSPATDTNYWVRVTTSVCFIDSATATLSMCTYPEVITPSPAQINIASGQSATLTLPPLSPVDNKTVTWYRGPSGDKSQLLASALNLNSYTTPALTATTQYWAEFTNNTCVSRTTTYTAAVCKPTITVQPQSTNVPSGGQTTLSVTATGAPLTYQWYLGSSGNTASPISGATNSSYTTPALTSNTTYWVRVSGCTTADSATATVSICTNPTITNLTKTAAHTPGGTGSVTVTATGTGLTYQWYKGQSGDTSRIVSGATAATYTFGLQTSEYYWVLVTSPCNGATANSAAIMYSVDPAITAQPQSVAIPSGSTATLTIQANGTYLSYKWYSTSSPNPIAGATSASYTTPALTTETAYYCVVTSGTTAVVYSSAATVSICTGPAIANITRQFLGGTSWRVTVWVYSPDDQNVKYSWYRGVPGSVAQSTFIGEGGSYLTVATPAQSTTYWARVWWLDDTCYSDTSGVAIP